MNEMRQEKMNRLTSISPKVSPISEFILRGIHIFKEGAHIN